MKPKLIIVQNGLRDLVGHYFETSVSIAEAARAAGLHPILATHINCPPALFPRWLEVYPLFRTDHAMGTPPPACADLQEIKADPYTGQRVSMEMVHSREKTLRDYLEQHVIPPSAPEEQCAALSRSRAFGVRDCGDWVHQQLARAIRAFSPLCQRASYQLLPPLSYSLLKLVIRGIRQGCIPPILQQIASRWLRGHVTQAGTSPPLPRGPALAGSLQQPEEEQYVRDALALLEPANCGHELEYALLFKRDLEQLLTLTDFSAHDHVLLATAHPREVLAVYLVARRLPPNPLPTFHLEFRHCVFAKRPTYEEFTNSASIGRQRAFLSLYAGWGPSPCIKLYTDTEILSAEYASLADLDFGVLPIPFRTHMVQPAEDRKAGPLNLIFLGEARDEKNFHWLPGLIEELLPEYVETGRVQFVIQATRADPQYNPRSAEALTRLRHLPNKHVKLVGVDAPLQPVDYYAMISNADIVLLPYDRDHYHAGSSGTLAEAIAAGKPVVVPAETWLSQQLPSGGGEAFIDEPSFRDCVRRIIEGYAGYQRRAKVYRHRWLALHTPANFIAALLQSATGSRELEAEPPMRNAG